MRSHEVQRKALGRRLRLVVLGLSALVTLTLSGCTRQIENGWLPSDEGVTNQTERIIDLWRGSWIAALLVGVLVWGLILWAVIVYRRRRGDTGVPPQVRYHIPLEIMYTAVPLMMVAVLFYYTARDESELISTKITPDYKVGVVGKQWSWDFNYINEDTYETGTQAQRSGDAIVEDGVPTVWLPVGKRVEFELTARDVIHSFWIPAFLMKMDTIPGVVNQFQVVPQVEGDFQGKCAELCGEYHAYMLFNVKVVSQAEYDAHMDDLRSSGQNGQLPTELGRSPLTPEGQRLDVENGNG